MFGRGHLHSCKGQPSEGYIEVLARLYVTPDFDCTFSARGLLNDTLLQHHALAQRCVYLNAFPQAATVTLVFVIVGFRGTLTP